MVYQQYSKEIYIYLYNLCNNTDLAEDLLQETFLKAILSLPDSHTNIRAWLYTVARNLYFNSLKKSKRISGNEIPEDLSDSSPGPEEQTIQNDSNQMLNRAISSLDVQKREIIQLFYYSKLSQKEIATIMKLSAENVRVLIYRAKKEIKKYMEDQAYDIL